MKFLQKYWLAVLTVICAALITWTGIQFQQPFLRMLPLYISLCVGMLQSRANRYASLVGGLNSLVYTFVYISLGLYANALYAIAVSFPLQIATFLLWKKRAYKDSVHFRSLKPLHWLFVLGGFGISFVLMNLILNALGGSYQLWDSTASLLGVLVTLLQMLAFREYSWLMFISGGSNIALNCSMLAQHPGQITFVIYALHSFICIIVQFFRVRALHKEQKESQ
ncbi:MAG: nicotinamide mononucleotide transporter [Oscillospiraceae bacterium]|nr:nicotinamide mononucleotide transporter [Oscillospiraceae bacterium]